MNGLHALDGSHLEGNGGPVAECKREVGVVHDLDVVTISVDVGDLDWLVLDKRGSLLSQRLEGARHRDALDDVRVSNFQFGYDVVFHSSLFWLKIPKFA